MGKVNDKEIIEAIEELGGKRDFEIFTAKVVAVHESDGLIDVAYEDVKLMDVRLLSVSDGSKGIMVVPKNGSLVSVGKIENGHQYVLLNASEVAKILTTCDEITYNGGDNKGLVKVVPLKNKLNNLEDKVNDLIAKLQAVIVPLAPSGTYPFAPLFASVTPLISTAQKDIENPKITH